ncbi:peptidoglycan editing factor PgeF [Hoeflea sp. TYP-13]|uniref:peptidoglycan editing factor PgeF n=1 Tax=Hoeflea sp. TYP-13 TaxID=3230023 RepID=UPI0034C5F331
MLDLGRPEPITSHLLDESCAGTAIRHGFFTRQGGVSEGIYKGLNVGLGSQDVRGHVTENRSRICNWFELPTDNLATPHQVHSADVFVVDEAYDGERPKADAVVSATPGIIVGVLTADCGPVLLADPQAGVVAAAHAGWRGALDGIIENTICTMERFGADRGRIAACLGPSISGENYEVGPEFVDRFVEKDQRHATYFIPSTRENHRLFNLQNYILDRLVESGVTAHYSGHCTYADETRFYSYRRTTHRNEPDYGRQISAISIVDGGYRGSAL